MRLSIALYFVAGGLLLFGDLRGFLRPVHVFAQAITIPVESRFFRGKEETLGKLGSLGELGEDKNQRIQELEERNALLSSQIAQIGSLRTENEHMRNLLGSSLPSSWKFTPARFISLQIDRLYAEAPSQDITGKPVIWVNTPEPGKTNYGVFLGRIEKIVGQRAEILLPTSSDSKVRVNVKDRDSGQKQAMGIVEGRGGRMILGQVLTGETLESGDIVVTAGDDNIPPDLILGYIDKVLGVEKGTFVQAEMKKPVEYGRLEEIFIVNKF